MPKTSWLAAAMSASLLVAGPATAGYTTFNGIDNNGNAGVQVAPTNSNAARANFLSNLAGVGTQDFESYAVGATAAVISPISFGAAGTATISGVGSVQGNGIGSTNGAGRYSVPGGVRYYETNAGSGTFDITFSSAIAAFGFYGVDLGDFAGTLQLELYNAANLLVSTRNVATAASAVADGSVLFYSLIAGTAADEFSRVRFVSTVGSGDVFAFDSFTIGTRAQVVRLPEPSSGALVALALLGLGLARRGQRA